MSIDSSMMVSSMMVNADGVIITRIPVSGTDLVLYQAWYLGDPEVGGPVTWMNVSVSSCGKTCLVPVHDRSIMDWFEPMMEKFPDLHFEDMTGMECRPNEMITKTKEEE